MHTAILETEDDPFESFLFRRQVELERNVPLDDIVPADARFAVQISAEVAESLIRHARDEMPWIKADSIAWDLRRLFSACSRSDLFGADYGLDLYEVARWILDGDEDETAAARLWPAFDRPREPGDILLIDLADDATHHGWTTPADLSAALERLRDLAEVIPTRQYAAAKRAAHVARAFTVELKPVPIVPFPTSQNSSMIGGDPTTAWASVDRFGYPASGDWANAKALLRRLKIDVRFNAWSERTEIRDAGKDWTERQDWHLDKIARLGSSHPHNYRPAESVLRRAIDSLARDNTVDPALELLDRLESEYDGTPRLRTWLTEAVGAPTDAYHQAVGATILGGLVSRIRVPGIKFDIMPVFVSEAQGTSKSTLARLMALNNDWFVEDIQLGESSKELVLLLAGKAVVEISEMRTRGEVNAVKAMVSRTHDEGRPAYGRTPIRRPRRHIFVGTTNEPEFLEDITGGRRFLPIVVQREINLAWVRENLPQLVGEAAALQSRGDDIGLPREMWVIAGEHQEAARIASAAEELLRDWYATDNTDVCVQSAIIVKRLADERQIASHKAVASIMRRLGYQPDRTATTRFWVKSITGKYHLGCTDISRHSVKLIPSPPR